MQVTEVAIGILLDGVPGQGGRFLMASRPEGKPYAGWWEFPGGKLEAGETVLQALAREYDEELGVSVRDASSWFVFENTYPHAHVRLHVCRIRGFDGQPRAKEGQTFRWFDSLEQALEEKLLPMCDLVIRRLWLPERAVYVSDPSSATLEADLEKKRAQAILTDDSDNPRLAELACRHAVPLVKAVRLNSETASENPALQTETVGFLTKEANSESLLKAARQRIPLYVPDTGNESVNAVLLGLGAQGVYTTI